MSLLRTLVLATAASSAMLAAPAQARAETCTTVEICVGIVITFCWSRTTCDGGSGEQNDSVE
ncbi:MAG: hypothetical protein ACOC05_10510 [Oceanicaulis sp.]